MKKIITLTTLIIMCCVLAACSTTNASIFNASYWLPNQADYVVSKIVETNIYSVSYKPSSEDVKLKFNLDSSSSYKTVLTNSEYGESKTPCYLLETTLKIVGTIDNNGETTPIDDLITAKCYFLGIKDTLKPLYSERNVSSHSLTIDTAENYYLHYYNYSIKTTYSDSSAAVDFKIGATNEGAIDLTEGISDYSGLNFNSYIDNEILLFAPRAMTLTSSTSKTFNTIDAVSKINRPMSIISFSDEPTKTIDCVNYFRNNEKVFKVATFCVNISIDSQYSGSPIKAYYADSSDRDERSSLISFSNEMPYGLGSFTYDIKSAHTAS